jgi:hypothetical protein
VQKDSDGVHTLVTRGTFNRVLPVVPMRHALSAFSDVNSTSELNESEISMLVTVKTRAIAEIQLDYRTHAVVNQTDRESSSLHTRFQERSN